jgi:hypothetical protein
MRWGLVFGLNKSEKLASDLRNLLDAIVFRARHPLCTNPS